MSNIDTHYGAFSDTSVKQCSDAQLNARLAEYGVKLRAPSGKADQWPTGWYPGDEPVQIVCEEDKDPYAGVRVFDAAQRVRFLDALAGHGNVCSAAARVGVSRETVYRARRRHADFAALWDAALVHARARGEAELTTRALDGVAVPVFVRGEHVATWHKQDARYLLAHLARLDQRIAKDPDAVTRAASFDHLLAAMAGHETPEDFACAAKAVRGYGTAVPADIPPSAEEYAAYARGQDVQIGGTKFGAEYGSEEYEKAEAAAMAKTGMKARKVWDEWDQNGAALLEWVLEAADCEAGGDAGGNAGGDAGCHDGGNPGESGAEPKPFQNIADAESQDTVTSVNTQGPRRRVAGAKPMSSAVALSAGMDGSGGELPGSHRTGEAQTPNPKATRP